MRVKVRGKEPMLMKVKLLPDGNHSFKLFANCPMGRRPQAYFCFMDLEVHKPADGVQVLTTITPGTTFLIDGIEIEAHGAKEVPNDDGSA